MNSAKNKQKGRPNVYFFSVEDLKILLSAVTRGYNEMRPKKSSPRRGKNDRLYVHMTFLNFKFFLNFEKAMATISLDDGEKAPDVFNSFSFQNNFVV